MDPHNCSDKRSVTDSWIEEDGYGPALNYNPLITGFASPTYSGINSIEALAKSTTVNKTILSYVSLTRGFTPTPAPTPIPNSNSNPNRT